MSDFEYYHVLTVFVHSLEVVEETFQLFQFSLIVLSILSAKQSVVIVWDSNNNTVIDLEMILWINQKWNSKNHKLPYDDWVSNKNALDFFTLMKTYELKLILGYGKLGCCAFLMGNVQKKALANSEAIWCWVKDRVRDSLFFSKCIG